MALKVLLMGSLAQVGLALATAVGAWINLLLVLGFAVRAGYLELDRALVQSLAKFLAVRRRAGGGAVVGCEIRRRLSGAHGRLARRGHASVLIVVGAIVYGASILLLFGTGWLRSLVRS